MPTSIDWSMLSPRGTAIARQIGSRLIEGYSRTEIAAQLGTTQRWVSDRAEAFLAVVPTTGVVPSIPAAPARCLRRRV